MGIFGASLQPSVVWMGAQQTYRNHQPIAADFRYQIQCRVDAQAQQLIGFARWEGLLKIAIACCNPLWHTGVAQETEQQENGIGQWLDALAPAL